MVDSNRVDRFAGSYTVGILGTIDLWDPSRGPRIRKAEATLEESRQEEKRLKDSIQESVSQTYAEYQSALRDLSNWQKALANAAIASDLTQTLYHEGKKTVADVVQMRLQKEQAEAALRENLLRILSLRARLYFLSGRLDDSNVMVLMRDIFP